MPDITATYDIDFSKVRGAFREVESLGRKASQATTEGGTAFRGQIKGAAEAGKGFAAVRQQSDAAARSSAQATGVASRFFTTVRRGAIAAGAIAAITVALVALNRRFPVIGQVASKAFSVVRTTASGAAEASQNFAKTLTNLKTAATVAVGVYSLARAFRQLRGDAAGAGNIRLPKAPGGGGLPGGIGKMLGPAAAGLAVAGLGVAVFGAVKSNFSKAIQQAAQMEQIKIGFEVLAGGAEPAKQVLGEIRELAENTPLRFVDLAGAGRQLLAFKEDAEDVPEILRRIGDVSSGIGAPIKEIAEIYGKARVQGTLFAEDINQLTGRGIDVISEFAGQLGVTTAEVKKLASEGKIGFPMLEEAFRSLTGEGGAFYGMMERQSKTVLGLWSTLKDRIAGALTAFGTPINDAIRPLLAQAVEYAGALKDQASALGTRIAGVINFVRAAFKALSGGEIMTVIGKALQLAFMRAIDVLARGIQAVFAAAQDASFMDALGEKIRGMGVILKDVLLAAVESVFAKMAEIRGLGFLGGIAEDIAKSREDAIAAEGVRRADLPEPPDLGAEFRKKFRDAAGLFGAEIEVVSGDMRGVLGPVFEEFDRLEAELASASGENAGNVGGTAGQQISNAAGPPALAGALQQAKNLIMGKTVNEVVAQEAARTNEKMDDVVSEQRQTKKVMEDVREILKGGKGKTSVEVVPTF